MKSRRQFLSMIAGASFAYKLRVQGQGSRQSRVDALLSQGQLTEENSGDPNEPAELLAFAPGQLQKASAPDKPTLKEKDAQKLRLRMLDLSRTFADAHVGRYFVPPDQTREFLKLFGFGLKYAGSDVYVPFCAAGVSYAACRAFCDIDPKQLYSPEIGYDENRLGLFRERLREIRKYYFFPSPAVQLIRADAEDRGTWLPSTVDPLPGWLVVYSWGSNKRHIGIIDHAEKNLLHTVEYNTTQDANGSDRNGGVVARKTRKRDSTVLGFVRIGKKDEKAG